MMPFRVMLSWLRKTYTYLANLQWTERIQHDCVFCDRANFASIVYEDEEIIAVDNIYPAGQHHWLILPKRHILRDIEGLKRQHLSLLQAMDRVKKQLLGQITLGASHSAAVVVHAGYHRGRRRLVGMVFWPDIVSIHHLHLHVIVKPYPWLCFFKYPGWLPLMWKADTKVLQEVQTSS